MDLLKQINDPAALRSLSRAELKTLADQLRTYLLESVSKTGGHLSSNLGTVELTIALHYVFTTPEDRIVWDVGHQTYPHKILTGRRDRMSTLRQQHGLSGFPRRDESPYDTFGTAHSSTSISAALGMALAARTKHEDRHSVAVIGDGAMTAGMVFEALNNVGIYDDIKMLVVLNDNDMSISPPVGALNRYLARLMSGKFYAAAKNVGKSVLPPSMLELAKRFEEHAKGMLVPATLFEEFGLNYIGPIDGHDLDSLIPTLQNLKNLEGPQFLHVVTKKGQGYKMAEADPVLYHGPGKFNPTEGIKPATASKMTYTQVFGDWLSDMAAVDDKLIGITPAMREGSGMVKFEQKYPERYYDVGIAEQHAVTFAAGLACEGLKPVLAIYSTFLQRGYDQLIHDVALQNLDVTFALDRAGLVGADGATHAGNYDMAFLRCIPNMVVMAASDENECRQMLTTGYRHPGPAAVRYPRGAGVGAEVSPGLDSIPIGKGEIRRKGKQIALLAFGTMVAPALQAAEKLNATVANMRFIKPLDAALVAELASSHDLLVTIEEALVAELASSHDLLVTIEEGCVMGGAGSAVAEALAAAGIVKPLLQLGLPDQFIDHGDAQQLLAQCGLDGEGIAASVTQRLGKTEPRLVVNNS
ncbi:MAG: 1-deoxy-D-xylulose-5-phosphate synthase [Oxalobacteraceae bacterium]|nr:1-deoxy-D-xylulose-5-phosphate synthase [Oxalobacteraceae bacterium]